jgi:hypothetical protein
MWIVCTAHVVLMPTHTSTCAYMHNSSRTSRIYYARTRTRTRTDDEEKDVFIVARDHLGIIPLYYGTDEEGAMWFASEMKSLNDACVEFQSFPPGKERVSCCIVMLCDAVMLRVLLHCYAMRRRHVVWNACCILCDTSISPDFDARSHLISRSTFIHSFIHYLMPRVCGRRRCCRRRRLSLHSHFSFIHSLIVGFVRSFHSFTRMSFTGHVCVAAADACRFTLTFHSFIR